MPLIPFYVHFDYSSLGVKSLIMWIFLQVWKRQERTLWWWDDQRTLDFPLLYFLLQTQEMVRIQSYIPLAWDATSSNSAHTKTCQWPSACFLLFYLCEGALRNWSLQHSTQSNLTWPTSFCLLLPPSLAALPSLMLMVSLFCQETANIWLDSPVVRALPHNREVAG